MEKRYFISQKSFVFSKWSRKKYAIFASLGKLIKIGSLSTKYCEKALLKSIIILNINEFQIEKCEEEDHSDYITDIYSNQFILLFVFLTGLLIHNSISDILFKKNSFFIASSQYTRSLIISTNSKSPIFVTCRNWAFLFKT